MVFKMTEFSEYPKIVTYGYDDVQGILDTPVTIQEKIDGANVCVYMRDGELKFGSHHREITGGDTFDGFVPYIKKYSRIAEYLECNPENILYGEWLIKRAIKYPQECYKQFYLFDIYDGVDCEYMESDLVQTFAMIFGVKYPKTFVFDRKMIYEEVMEYVGQSGLGEQGEGVIIKSRTFKNKYYKMPYAKIVIPKYKEMSKCSRKWFEGDENPNEKYVAEKYCTEARVRKIMFDINATTREMTSRLTLTCYRDLIDEEIWEIIKKPITINFDVLKRICLKKFAVIYHDILDSATVS